MGKNEHEKIVTICEFEISCRICGKRLGFAEIPVQAICESCKHPAPEIIPTENLLKILEDSRNYESSSATLVVTESGRVLSKNGKKEKTWLKIV